MQRQTFKRVVKPDGPRRRSNPNDYVCRACGRTPHKCEYCGAFTCLSCTINGLCCRHCQRKVANG